MSNLPSPPRPPPAMNNSVRPSNDRFGWNSANVVLTGGPTLTGVDHASWTLRRGSVHGFSTAMCRCSSYFTAAHHSPGVPQDHPPFARHLRDQSQPTSDVDAPLAVVRVGAGVAEV